MGVLPGIFGGGVPPISPNPDPISDQKMPFPTPVFRPGLKNPYPFSDRTLYVIKHSICISANGSQRNKDEQVKLRQLLASVAGKKNNFISIRERSPDNHNQFQTNMFKIYTRFQTKTAQKPYTLGWHIPIYLIWGSTPPPPTTGKQKKKTQNGKFSPCRNRGAALFSKMNFF